jgi:hypothetical protein
VNLAIIVLLAQVLDLIALLELTATSMEWTHNQIVTIVLEVTTAPPADFPLLLANVPLDTIAMEALQQQLRPTAQPAPIVLQAQDMTLTALLELMEMSSTLKISLLLTLMHARPALPIITVS